MKGAVILKTCCFTVLSLMLSSFFVVELTNSELYRNIYIIIVVIFIVIIDIYFLKKTTDGKGFQSKERANTLKWDNNVPAWGITRNNNIKELRINGKKVDVIKTIEGQDNKEFYFWYVKDMGKNGLLEEISISYEE